MSNYKHILLAVDFYENCSAISQRARDLALKYQVKLSIIHVVDNLPLTDTGYGPEIPFNIDFTNELIASARIQLGKIAEELSINEDQQWLEMGSPKIEITRIAKENKVDLIVIGSHGRHGWALLLGSTANGVLHHASCDVLAVRLQEN